MKASRFTSLNNTRGQSLVQVLVGGAVASIISLAIISTQMNQARENRALGEKLAALDLSRSIITILNDPVACSALFASSNVVGGSTVVAGTPTTAAPFNLNLKTISAGGGNVLAQAGANVPGLASSLKILPTPQGIKVSVTSISPNPNTATLTVGFDQTRLVRAIHDLTFPLSFINTGASITGCGSSPSMATICTALGGVIDPLTGKCKIGTTGCNGTPPSSCTALACQTSGMSGLVTWAKTCVCAPGGWVGICSVPP